MSLLRLINEQIQALTITPEHLRQAAGNGMHFIAEVPVEKFLELTTSSRESEEQIMQMCRTVDDYNKWAEMGENIIMPLLDVDIDAKKITAHEGRHRAAALLCAGARAIPVSFKLKEPKGETLQDKYGYWDAKYQARFEDMPDVVTGQYGRGSLSKSDLNVKIDGWDNIKAAR